MCVKNSHILKEYLKEVCRLQLACSFTVASNVLLLYLFSLLSICVLAVLRCNHIKVEKQRSCKLVRAAFVILYFYTRQESFGASDLHQAFVLYLSFDISNKAGRLYNFSFFFGQFFLSFYFAKLMVYL